MAYEIGYEPDLIDPNETYVVKAAIVDEGNVWGAPQGDARDRQRRGRSHGRRDGPAS